MLIRIKKVEYFGEYKLKILFSNGKLKIVNFENWISEGKGYFRSLKDIDFFKKVRLDDCKYSICWPNGADFCPDVLYEMGQELPKSRVLKRPKKDQKCLTKKCSVKSKRKVNSAVE
jgi:hypothetical protein